MFQGACKITIPTLPHLAMAALATAALAVQLFAPASVDAQASGRVILTVTNPEGELLKDVAITITSKELNQFQEKITTNKKGKATISFVNATKTYEFEFKHPDYQDAMFSISPKVKQNMFRDITMTKGAVATVGGNTDNVIFTPAESAFNDGVKALQTGEMATAKESFSKAVELNPKMADAHSALAGIYLSEGSAEQALGSAQRFLELNPDHPRGLQILHEAYNSLGRTDEARAVLEKLTKLEGGNTSVLVYNSGVAAFKVGDYKKAQGLFLEALQREPTPDAELASVSALTKIYIVEKNYADAAPMSERLLQLDPDNDLGLKVRYDAYTGLGNKEKAEEAFAALAAADPGFVAETLYNRGSKHFEGGNIEAAKVDLLRVIELQPDNAKAHYRLGLCYVNSSDNEKAKQHLAKFAELAPDDPDAALARDMISHL